MLPWRVVVALLSAVLAISGLAGCASQDQGKNTDDDLVDSVDVPKNGVCRDLTPDDVSKPTNATETVACSEQHTAETYAVGELPGEFDKVTYDDEGLATFAYQTCSRAFATFVGADESVVLRTLVSWAWFRPSSKAWDKGARWYRCDVIGGNSASASYRSLPETAKQMLAGRPKDMWMICEKGARLGEGEKVPCAQKHTWRAVTTVKIGEPSAAYPGDRVMESRTRSFCRTSVQAWLGYPATFEFAFTFFHTAEWKAGLRRSVCWAKTNA